MAKKYIDAEKLKAEIKKRINELEHDKYLSVNSKTARIAELHFIDRSIDSLQQDQPEVDLENYISNKLRELGADLIKHKPYSFNRGLNVGEGNAYQDILDRLNARKEE